MQTVDCECWLCVDAAGDYGVGACPQSAREAYEEDVQPLNEADGYRLVKVQVKVPLPEVVELTGVAPAQGTAELTEVA